MEKSWLLVKSIEVYDDLFLLKGELDPYIDFKPGQYLWFYKNVEGKQIKRAYSFANIPGEDTLFVIKPVGIMSNYLKSSIGDIIYVEGPDGHIEANKLMDKDCIILFGSGPGLGPLRSIFVYLLKNSYSGVIKFNYITNSTNFPFINELNKYPEDIFIVSGEPMYNHCLSGINTNNCVFVVIGPTPFVISVRNTLIKKYNINKTTILIEPHGFI